MRYGDERDPCEFVSRYKVMKQFRWFIMLHCIVVTEKDCGYLKETLLLGRSIIRPKPIEIRCFANKPCVR